MFPQYEEATQRETSSKQPYGEILILAFTLPPSKKSPNQPSRGLEHETWNANYSIDRVSEWVYLIVGRLLLGLHVRVCVKPWPFFLLGFVWKLHLSCFRYSTNLHHACKFSDRQAIDVNFVRVVYPLTPLLWIQSRKDKKSSRVHLFCIIGGMLCVFVKGAWVLR